MFTFLTFGAKTFIMIHARIYAQEAIVNIIVYPVSIWPAFLKKFRIWPANTETKAPPHGSGHSTDTGH
jgi:hypothetical protein